MKNFQKYVEAKLDFITHESMNTRADSNKSRLHLHRNGSDKIGKNFYFETLYMGHGVNCVKSNHDPSINAGEVYISENNDVNASKETNQGLRCLHIKILKKLITGK